MIIQPAIFMHHHHDAAPPRLGRHYQIAVEHPPLCGGQRDRLRLQPRIIRGHLRGQGRIGGNGSQQGFCRNRASSQCGQIPHERAAIMMAMCELIIERDGPGFQTIRHQTRSRCAMGKARPRPHAGGERDRSGLCARASLATLFALFGRSRHNLKRQAIVLQPDTDFTAIDELSKE